EINEAYAVLSNKEKRQQYDMFGSEGFHQRFTREDIFRGFDIGDLLRDSGFGTEDIFSRIFGGRRPGGFERGAGFEDVFGRPIPQRGADVTAGFRLSLHEAAFGGEKRVTLRRPDGETVTVTVKMPPGIDTGMKLKVPAKGMPGERGQPPGDLYFNVTVEEDPTFKREGDDVVVEKKVKFTEAVLGGYIEVPTLEGEVKKVKIPPGTDSGTNIRIKGYGISHLKGKGRGDLYIKVEITVPDQLTERQKRLLEEMAREGM
ncbi:MAG: J domain-containing protein, partial [Deltaproteobacteria bacterium]|nr:J domain-containing protein [Deltaproteobacteria bacterium]